VTVFPSIFGNNDVLIVTRAERCKSCSSVFFESVFKTVRKAENHFPHPPLSLFHKNMINITLKKHFCQPQRRFLSFFCEILIGLYLIILQRVNNYSYDTRTIN
jgi:hypothetical protein